MMSSRSVACGLMRVQMSIVKRVLLLLKMEAKEDMRAANITASIRPRNPAQVCGRKEGVWKKRVRGRFGMGYGKKKIKLLFLFKGSHRSRVLTVRHDRHHQFGISNVGAADLSPTYTLTHLRDNTANLIYK